jgi:hypothetical protein
MIKEPVFLLARQPPGTRAWHCRRPRLFQGTAAGTADHHWPADRAGRVPAHGHRAFEGNRAETKTMLPVTGKFTAAHRLPDVTVVADAGMATDANMKAIEAAGCRSS